MWIFNSTEFGGGDPVSCLYFPFPMQSYFQKQVFKFYVRVFIHDFVVLFRGISCLYAV